MSNCVFAAAGSRFARAASKLALLAPALRAATALTRRARSAVGLLFEHDRLLGNSGAPAPISHPHFRERVLVVGRPALVTRHPLDWTCGPQQLTSFSGGPALMLVVDNGRYRGLDVPLPLL
jgi:hypothetical protein